MAATVRVALFRLSVMIASCLLVFGIITPPQTAQAAPLPVKPNIILIVGDDVGYGDIGAYGATDVRTPSIDALAKQGVRAVAGYSVASMCAPSRAGLLTGRYPQRYGFENNPGPAFPHFGLPTTETMLSGTLKSAGYATGAIGKWHLGKDPQFHPNGRNFVYYYGFSKECCHSYFPISGDEPIQRNGVTVPDPPYLTDAFGQEAVKFINDHQAGPFLLYVAFNAAHEKLEAKPEDLARFPNLTGERKKFAAVMWAMDQQIGNIVKKADTITSRPTLIIFVSDNGGATNAGGNNKPFNAGKGTLSEGGIRTAFVMRMTGTLPAGRVVYVPVSQLDIFPTVAALAGAQLPPKPLDGRNILPLMKGTGTLPARDLFFRYAGGPPWAIRNGDLKLMKNAQGVLQLYDVSGLNERPITNPTVAAQLQARFNIWNAQLMKPLWWQ